MNELEKQREKIAKATSYSSVVKVGFDAAIGLNLPVKFHKWYMEAKWVDYDDFEKIVKMTPEELYKYWIENIYKPE